MITQEYLQHLFDYNPETGWLINRIQRGQRGSIGARAGNYDKDGYLVTQIDGQKYRVGRLIWFYVTGEWPIEVDHEDGVRDNDSWVNLREATRNENNCNSNRAIGMSGLRGVKRDPRNPTLWRARIAYGNYRKWLGPFDSLEKASQAYLEAVELHHGEFSHHKRPQPLDKRI